jgi:hypothetical protein
MKAITANPPSKRQPALLTPLAGPKCEVLFDVFNGELGRVQLGRMLSGSDAGRLVTLRNLVGEPSAELEAAADAARAVAHPKLAKALGLLRAGDSWQLLSEYIPGVTLFELLQATALRNEWLDAPVAARVTLDLLDAAVAAGHLLRSIDANSVRFIHPESIWVAEFGETFLSEVSTSAILANAQTGSNEARRADTPESQDVHAAGLLLLELACGSTAPSTLEDPFFPDRLREIVARAIGARGADRFDYLAAFAEALAELEPNLLATEEEVSRELRRFMSAALDTRRQKLAMTERVSLQEGGQDETKFFRAAAASAERETARPPPELAPSTRELGAYSSKHRIQPRSDPPDDPTTIFRRPDIARDTVPDPHGPREGHEESSALAEVTPAPARTASIASAAPSSRVHASFAEIDSGNTKSRRATRRRIAVLLLLVVALAAFAATSGSSLAFRWFH